jgi:DUF971 family protein
MSEHSTHPIPTKITLHKLSRVLEVEFDSGERFLLPCAYLRAFSTSAEMRHGVPPTNADLLIKAHINILAIEPVGQYAIKPIFSDGHRTGIYSWSTLYELGKNLAKNWENKEEEK